VLLPRPNCDPPSSASPISGIMGLEFFVCLDFYVSFSLRIENGSSYAAVMPVPESLQVKCFFLLSSDFLSE
jgi:hypothetical protein